MAFSLPKISPKDTVEFYNLERPDTKGKFWRSVAKLSFLGDFLGKVFGKVDEEHPAMVEEAICQVTRFLVTSAAS